MTTSEASSDGSSVLTLSNPAFETGCAAPMYAQGAGAGNASTHAVTPTSSYAFPSHPPQQAGTTLPNNYMYSTSMHPTLLSVPLQPSALGPSAVPSFPQVHHPHQTQAPAKAAPNLFYPSALDLLGHAIYE